MATAGYTLIATLTLIAVAVALRECRTHKQRIQAIEWVWDARHVIDHGAIVAPIVVERAMEECEKLGMIDESAKLEQYYQENWRPYDGKISHLV